MKKLFYKKEYYLNCVCTILILCLLIFLCACQRIVPNLEAKKMDLPPTLDIKQKKRNNNQASFINFKGVLFQCNLPSVTAINGIEQSAIILEEETDKPDSVRPQHILLKLEGEYAERHKNSVSSPSVEIYPIADFRQALSKSENYVRTFDEKINSLKDIISKKNSKLQELPRIPFFDSSAAIKSKVKYISFKNGEGILYITQFNIEPHLINNAGLTYVFQGITSDNRYYIFATFSVNLDFLPESYNTYKFEDYELPEYFLDPKNVKKNGAEYVKYLSLIEKRIDKTNSEDFNPSLTKIEECISSLEVNWNN